MYWLARHKPYGIVLLTALMLAGSFPPSPLNFLIFIAFVPVFVLFEKDVVPIKVPEDKVFRPFKSFATVSWRLLTLQFLWRRPTRGRKVFSYRRKFISGNAQLYRYTYLIFLIWNGLCCYWLTLTALGAASFLEGLVSATAGILAVVLNPALMSLPFQFFSRIRHVFTPTWSTASLVVFWLTFEYLHFNWDLSWSWLTLGHALSPWPSMIQYAEITGVLGISLHIIVANLLCYGLYRNFFHRRKRRVRNFAIGAAAWILLPLALNPLFTHSGRDILQPTGELTVRIVQPNIDPYLKYNYYTPAEQITLFRDLILSKPLEGIDLVVLPETAIPRRFNLAGLRRNRIMAPLWEIADSMGVPILTGFEEYKLYEAKDAPISARQTANGDWVDGFNSATVLRPGKIPDSYQKSKLVPMVERLPFLEFLHSLKDYNMDLGTGMGGYGIPDSAKVLAVRPDLNVGLMICYESEFGDLVRASSLLGARFFAIITNDGWWGNSSGYIQHAHFASIRAIENRRSIARSANTGRSLFVDPLGNISQETNWWETAVIDQTISLHDGTTFYARHGDYIGRISLWLTLVIVLIALGIRYLGKGPQ